jgi:RNA polymerase sigma-70 factor, ECF subfamily
LRVDPLLRAFVDAAGGYTETVDSIDAALRRLVEDARSAYPAVDLDLVTFGRHLGERVAEGPSTVGAIAKLRGRELFLACACAQGDRAAIAAFEREFLAPAAAALVRAGEARADVDDAQQALRERLFAAGSKVREFSGRGSLSGWTRVSLARQHTTLRRAKGRTVPLEGDVVPDLAGVDPDLAVVRRRYGGAFQVAFQDAFRTLTPEQRNVLRLHFVDGLNLERIAPLLHVSRATAGRRMLDAKAALLESLLALLGERLKATRSEIRSLFAVVRSTLYGSLGALLRE